MKTNEILIIKLCYPVERIFQDIIDTITDIKTDEIKYPNCVYYFNKDKCIAEYDYKNNYFWCGYDSFWSKFYLNNNFNYLDVRYLFNPMVEEHFKLKGITTIKSLRITKRKVEEHFKLKGVTTHPGCSTYPQ